MSMYPCPCCGSEVLTEPGAYEICEICGWEDDPSQSADPTLQGGANGPSLNQARWRWEKSQQEKEQRQAESRKTLKLVRELDGVQADGTKTRVKILLGEPYAHGRSFRCPVAIEGIHFENRYPDIGGFDPLQSMLLAIHLAKEMLEDFLEHGGSLFYADSTVSFDLKNW